MMHDEMGDRYGRRARKCGACDRKGCGSARSLQVVDLQGCCHSISSAGTVGVLAEWPNVATFSDLYAHYDVVCRIGRRSTMRNRELYRTTERLFGVDGTPRRQIAHSTSLGKIVTYSET